MELSSNKYTIKPTNNMENYLSDHPLHCTELPAQLIDSYGFLQCTCEKYPRVTHINDKMLEYLGITEDNSGWYEFLKDNIFFMIPFEERDAFQICLKNVLDSTENINMEQHLLRSDGTQITLMSWMGLAENERGEKEYSFIYMPLNVKQRETQDMDIQNHSYFRALTSAYNVIFEVDLITETVECIHGRETSSIGAIYDVHMTLESARHFWLNNYIIKEDQAKMENFFDQIFQPRFSDDSEVSQTECCIKWADNVVYHFIIAAVHLDPSKILLCCRDISEISCSETVSRESIALSKLHNWMDTGITRNTSALGMILLEVTEHKYSLIYISKCICDYLDLDVHEYLRCIADELPIEWFLKKTGLSFDNFKDLLNGKQLKHTVKTRDSAVKQLTLNCRIRKTPEKTCCEVLVFDDVSQSSPSILKKEIFARTFGHFDLFVDGLPVTFSSNKEKELMALLIDRNGGTISTTEAIGYLWENEEVNERVSSRYRKLAMSLKNTLSKYGIEYLMINNHGVRSIDVSALKCDYYELLAGNEKYREAFHNSYMTDYSWAEETLAALWNYS